MKIKHFQGYGSIIATKVSKTSVTDFSNGFGEKKTKLVIKVKGNHEWGLNTRDEYNAIHWLMPKFDKTVNNSEYWKINASFAYGSDEDGVEVGYYTFIY